MISKPKTPAERLVWAYQFGHAWNRAPEYANLRNLDLGRVKLMRGDEADAKLLIASYQDFDPNVERLVRAFHGRELQPNGEVGPATEAAMNIKRCAMTDFAPPAGADLSTEIWDDPELLGAIQSYQRYAAFQNNDAEYVGGSGSWPKGCDPTRKDVHSTRVNVITTAASDHQKSQLKEVLAAVERCEAQIGQAVRHILDGDPQGAEFDVRYQFIGGSVIGYCYFPQPDTCNQVIICRLDNSFNVGPMVMAELNQHEYKGHGDGAEHKNRTASKKSIMHPSIGNPTDWPTWINDATEPQKRRWFGGVAIPTGEPPPPPPPPPPDDFGVTFADIVVTNAKGVSKTFSVVPKGGTKPPPIEV